MVERLDLVFVGEPLLPQSLRRRDLARGFRCIACDNFTTPASTKTPSESCSKPRHSGIAYTRERGDTHRNPKPATALSSTYAKRNLRTFPITKQQIQTFPGKDTESTEIP